MLYHIQTLLLLVWHKVGDIFELEAIKAPNLVLLSSSYYLYNLPACFFSPKLIISIFLIPPPHPHPAPSDSLLTRWPLEWVIASVNPQLGFKSMNYDISLIIFTIIIITSQVYRHVHHSHTNQCSLNKILPTHPVKPPAAFSIQTFPLLKLSSTWSSDQLGAQLRAQLN